MDRARPRSLYLPPETWEAIRKRAKKRKMKISHFGWLCCERAAREEAASAQPAGHVLALSADEQHRMQGVAQFGRFAVSAADGREMSVLLHEVVRILPLWNYGRSA